MFKSKEIENLYHKRLDRYMAAIRRQPTDRVPIVFNTCYFAEEYSGSTLQEIVYQPEKWLACDVKFSQDYPEVDTFRTNIAYAPTWDVADYKLYKVPGREIDPKSLQQFCEDEWMKADEYREFIDDPIGYRFNTYFPRILGEFKERGSIRSYLAFLKSGFLQGIVGGIMQSRAQLLKYEYGILPTTIGMWTAPFDILSDNYRGLHGIMKDMFRQKDMIKEACKKIMEITLANSAALVDPNKQFPIFIATHKPCFMSPKQFDEFYWPTFYEGMMTYIDAG
ncbi:MAG: uroporphyrinogen decarboxylase family protein, partial [Eubacterium sp.]